MFPSVGTLGPSIHRSRRFYSSLKPVVHDHGHASSLDMFHYSEALAWGSECVQKLKGSRVRWTSCPPPLWSGYVLSHYPSYQILVNVGQKTCCCFCQQSHDQQMSSPCGLALLPGTLSRIFSSILRNLGFIHLKNLVQELLWIFIFYFWKMLLAKCSLVFTIQLLFRVAYFYIYRGVFSPDWQWRSLPETSHTSIFWRVFLQGKDSKLNTLLSSNSTSRWNGTWKCYSALCLFLDSFLHLKTVKPDLCVLNRTMTSMDIQLVFIQGIISPGCASVHLSWSFLSLWCGGTISPWTSFMPRISSLEATALEIGSKSSFLLFIHHEASWTPLESEHFNWKSFWWFAFNFWRKKETKSKSLQTWVGFLNVLIFSVRKSLI